MGRSGCGRTWSRGLEALVNTVAESMARQGLVGRAAKRKRRSLTRPDKAAAPILIWFAVTLRWAGRPAVVWRPD